MQFSAVEKTEIRKSLKRGSSQTEMDRVVSEWNEKHPERKIDSGHVKRLRDQLPAFDNADAFWQSVEMEVSSKTRQVNAKDEWELKDLPEKGSIPALDAGKIPDISEDELKKFNFDFQNEKYNRQDESGSFAGSDKRLRNDFRDFMEKQGMIYGSFGDFLGRVEREKLDTDAPLAFRSVRRSRGRVRSVRRSHSGVCAAREAGSGVCAARIPECALLARPGPECTPLARRAFASCACAAWRRAAVTLLGSGLKSS